jgi:hypothetical protein
MQLCFQVVGALIGFKYRIVLQEVDILVHRVIQQQEISFSPTYGSASNVIRAELAILDSTKTDRFKFAIGVWDTNAGLGEEEALVARYDASVPLLKREHALTTDNATEWYDASPPTPPPVAAAPLATAPTCCPRHVHAAPAPPALSSRRSDAGSAHDDAVCVLNQRQFSRDGGAGRRPVTGGQGGDAVERGVGRMNENRLGRVFIQLNLLVSTASSSSPPTTITAPCDHKLQGS